jgi:hypothetical protein
MGEIKNRAILITGTVVPNSNYVAYTNAEARLEEYYRGLLFYADIFRNDDIFFLENSEYDFSKSEKFVNLFSEKKITLLKFPKSDKYEQGKGYQEFEMLDGAIGKISGMYNSFIKITGRYKVSNIKEITNIYCDNIVIDCHKKPGVAQTNVFYCTMEFYKVNIKSLYTKADDSKEIFIEKVVYEKIMKKDLKNKARLFSKNPLIEGISGSYGGTLNRNKTKMKIRNIERKLLSAFGIRQFLIEY